eukprot:6183892-Pleurochrysis_carterae.AAC.3
MSQGYWIGAARRSRGHRSAGLSLFPELHFCWTCFKFIHQTAVTSQHVLTSRAKRCRRMNLSGTTFHCT